MLHQVGDAARDERKDPDPEDNIVFETDSDGSSATSDRYIDVGRGLDETPADDDRRAKDRARRLRGGRADRASAGALATKEIIENVRAQANNFLQLVLSSQASYSLPWVYHEHLALARSIDALLEEEAPSPQVLLSLEVQVRHFAVLHLGDSTGNWELAGAGDYRPTTTPSRICCVTRRLKPRPTKLSRTRWRRGLPRRSDVVPRRGAYLSLTSPW